VSSHEAPTQEVPTQDDAGPSQVMKTKPLKKVTTKKKKKKKKTPKKTKL
jgi:hypothetical protein